MVGTDCLVITDEVGVECSPTCELDRRKRLLKGFFLVFGDGEGTTSTGKGLLGMGTGVLRTSFVAGGVAGVLTISGLTEAGGWWKSLTPSWCR